MSVSNFSLPKPNNWQDFEKAVRILFGKELNDPNIQLEGRSGQRQYGVDAWGYRNGNVNVVVGIQCRLTDKNKIDPKELRAEVEKAKDFSPKISEYFFVSTVPRDQKIQETARKITEELYKTDHPIKVYCWGWEDIEERAFWHPEALKAFDPTFDSFTERSQKIISQDVKDSGNMIIETIKQLLPTHVYPLANMEKEKNTPLHGKITTLQELIDEGEVHSALRKLEKLKRQEGEANRYERYRLLIALASGKIELGEYEEAGRLLKDAYQEFPEHEKALKHLALGDFLLADYKNSQETSEKLLKKDETDTFAASILIQSLQKEGICEDPLSKIPEGLLETEEVFVAKIQVLRGKQDIEWVKAASEGIKKYPKNRWLRIFYGEAVLERLIRFNNDALISGENQEVSQKELDTAVSYFKEEIFKRIEKELPVEPSTVNNTALAFRLAGCFEMAKEVLDVALNQYPDDERLRLQRALISYLEGEFCEAIKTLPKNPLDSEVITFKAYLLERKGENEKAWELIKSIENENLPYSIKMEALGIQVRLLLNNGEKQKALDLIRDRLPNYFSLIEFRIIQIQLFRSIKDLDKANEIFDEALGLVTSKTSLQNRIDLSSEAEKLNRDRDIIRLLKGRVSKERENLGLKLLIAALINSGSWVTAIETLNSLPNEVKRIPWFFRAEVILAKKIGDPLLEKRIISYLEKDPTDLDMLFVLIEIWQRDGELDEIKKYLEEINLEKVRGNPEQLIYLAQLISQYSDYFKGLKFAYSILMNNWKQPYIRLWYHPFILFNDRFKETKPQREEVSENTVVCLNTEEGEKRYRLEKETYAYFEEERLKPNEPLWGILEGRKVGEKFKIREYTKEKTVEVKSIKSIYLDALQVSLERFNVDFPGFKGLQGYSFDPNKPDAIEEIEKVVKKTAEANEMIIEKYKNNLVPLSFISQVMGINVIDLLLGFEAIGEKVKVCRGIRTERIDGEKRVIKNGKTGCLVDAITLSTIRRLGLEKVIEKTCGPIYTTQDVIELFFDRIKEVKGWGDKDRVYLSWGDGRLVYEKVSKEMMRDKADDLEKELSWVKKISKVISAVPKKDLKPEAKIMVDFLGLDSCSPAIAAEGNNLLLLSEDMGYRSLAEKSFDISTVWLQPVLTIALEEQNLTLDEYCEAVNYLVFYNHTYISLDPNCLIYQARKDKFSISKEMEKLFEAVGGPLSDLHRNSDVLLLFFQKMWKECNDEIKAKRLMSEGYKYFTMGREEDYVDVIKIFLDKMLGQNKLMVQHSKDWLIGQSMGKKEFNYLMKQRKNLE